jgi:hypothetical protein
MDRRRAERNKDNMAAFFCGLGKLAEGEMTGSSRVCG